MVTIYISAPLDTRECLQYKLQAKKDYDQLRSFMIMDNLEDNILTPTMELGAWGHEFVRALTGDIGQEYNRRVIELGMDPTLDSHFQDLLELVETIVPFHITHNAEAEAVDLLIELQRLDLLLQTPGIDDKNYARICLYLIKTADYMSDPDDLAVRLDKIWKNMEDVISSISPYVIFPHIF